MWLYWTIYAYHITFASALKVFSFEPGTNSSDLSYVSLSRTSGVALPDKWILCTSHQQARMDAKSFYHIYGQDGAPWMSTKFGNNQNIIGLWGVFGSQWIYFGNIPEPKLYFWYHMCHYVDTTKGIISVSINGQRMKSDVTVKSLMINQPKLLDDKMVLGKETKVSTTRNYYDQQYLGSVSNINVFKAGNTSIDSLSALACSQEGDLLPWSTSSWILTGKGITEREEEPSALCSGKGRYNLGLPVGLDQQQAVLTCTKLGQGRMTVSRSQQELRIFVTWFERAIPGKCSNIWTPYSDEAEEGVYRSLEDGSLPSFLPWAPGQPNGDKTENGGHITSIIIISLFVIYLHIWS